MFSKAFYVILRNGHPHFMMRVPTDLIYIQQNLHQQTPQSHSWDPIPQDV